MRAVSSLLLSTIRLLWAAPLTLWAVPLAPLLLHGRCQIRQGAFECYGPGFEWFLDGPWFRAITGGAGFAAVTIGHVIIGRDANALARCAAHEREHVRQGERWGILFPAAYLLAGLYATARHRSLAAGYHANPFEVAARAAELAFPGKR